MIEYLDHVVSTQDEMRKRLASLDPHTMTAIVAKEQLKGRGREGRIFRSPVGGLYMTVAVHLPGPLQKYIALSLITGLAIARLIPNIRLKWPNDLLIDHKKVGGILIETSAPWWLVGIGMNVTTPMEALEGLDVPVTTLGAFPHLDRKILEHLEEMLPQFRVEGFAPFQKEYLEKSAYAIGDKIRMRGRSGCTFAGITAVGQLSIDSDGGREDLTVGELDF